MSYCTQLVASFNLQAWIQSHGRSCSEQSAIEVGFFLNYLNLLLLSIIQAMPWMQQSSLSSSGDGKLNLCEAVMPKDSVSSPSIIIIITTTATIIIIIIIINLLT
jgi:hypothetical protein